MRERGLSSNKVAADLGVSPRAIRFYMTGGRMPRWPVIEKIADYTDNEVTASDWARLARLSMGNVVAA